MRVLLFTRLSSQQLTPSTEDYYHLLVTLPPTYFTYYVALMYLLLLPYLEWKRVGIGCALRPISDFWLFSLTSFRNRLCEGPRAQA